MISAKVEMQKQVVLQMSEDEARWLMEYLPYSSGIRAATHKGPDPQDEHRRGEFFNALKKALS